MSDQVRNQNIGFLMTRLIRTNDRLYKPPYEKTLFCICKNKGADQLRDNRAADPRLCFHYTDCTIPLLPKSEISSLQQSSVAVQPGFCQTWSDSLKTGFLVMRLTLCPTNDLRRAGTQKHQTDNFIQFQVLLTTFMDSISMMM